VFRGARGKLTAAPRQLEPWGYAVYEYQP